LGDTEDILCVGQVCKDWNSTIEHPVSWSGCKKINEKFIHSKYFKYLRVIDFSDYHFHQTFSFDIRYKWLEKLNVRSSYRKEVQYDYVFVNVEDLYDEYVSVSSFPTNFLAYLTKLTKLQLDIETWYPEYNFQIDLSNNKQLT